MLGRFDLRPGIDDADFRAAYALFATRLKAEGLIASAGPMGRREADTPMDTDAPGMPEYFAIMSFRDRRQLDAAYARFKASISGHEAVLAGVRNSIFTCWRDLDQQG